MTALTADRNTQMRAGDQIVHPLAAGAVIHAGALIALDAAGNAVAGATATTLTAIGRADESADNSAGAAGALTVTVRRGVFNWANDAADPVVRADIGAVCYIVDDQSVAKTNGVGTRSAAGKIIDLDAAGVWVEM